MLRGMVWPTLSALSSKLVGPDRGWNPQARRILALGRRRGYKPQGTLRNRRTCFAGWRLLTIYWTTLPIPSCVHACANKSRLCEGRRSSGSFLSTIFRSCFVSTTRGFIGGRVLPVGTGLLAKLTSWMSYEGVRRFAGPKEEVIPLSASSRN